MARPDGPNSWSCFARHPHGHSNLLSRGCSLTVGGAKQHKASTTTKPTLLTSLLPIGDTHPGKPAFCQCENNAKIPLSEACHPTRDLGIIVKKSGP